MAFVAKLPDPIGVTTPSRGLVTMRWVSMSSLFGMERLRKELGATDELVVRVLHEHLLSPAASLDELRAWPAVDRDALAMAWAADPQGLNQSLAAVELPTAFAEAIDARVRESGARIRGTVRSQFEMIERQHRQLLGLRGAGIVDALESFRRRQEAWQRHLLGPWQALERAARAARLEESMRRRQELLFASLGPTHLLAGMTAAIAANERLAGMAIRAEAMTVGLRATAEHMAQLHRMADLRGPTGAAAVAFAESTRTLMRSAGAVLNDWQRRGHPPVGAWLREAPALEVFSASRAAAAAIGPVVEDDAGEAVQRLEIAALRVEPLLAKVDPDLVTMYQGAAHAIAEQGPDSTRHLAISGREILTHVLHRLAPDAELHDWDRARPEDFPNKKPTRRLRIRYILRKLLGTAYEQFVDDDVEQAIDLFNALHGDTHGLGRQLEPGAQRIVLRRLEGVLAVLLEAAFGEDA